MKNQNITEKIIREYTAIAETPNNENWNKIEGGINRAENKRASGDWQKNIIRFALPALIIFGVFCFQMFGGDIAKLAQNQGILGTENSGNVFFLAAYASEATTFEITKEMKVLLPAGTWIVEHRDGGIGVSWRAEADIPGGFAVQGENIKSVKLESNNGTFNDGITSSQFIRNASDEELFARIREHGHYQFYVNPVYLEGDDILNLQYYNWTPIKLINARLEGNYREYYKDIVTVTVVFDDGEVITQIVEITIDENTGAMFAQILG